MAYPVALRRLPRTLSSCAVPCPSLLLALACAGLGGNLWAQAPSPSVAPMAAVRSYQIPAGTLEEALNRFGRDSGLLLSFTQEQVQGLRSPGVQGSHTAQGGLTALLQGSGLEAVAQPQGGYVLRPAARPAVVQPPQATGSLAEVRVAARRANDGTTEGTGSYTSRVTSIASKTDQSFREIPQSVSVVTREQLDDQRLTDVTDALIRVPGLTYNGTNFLSRGFDLNSMQIDGGAPLAIGNYVYQLQQNMAFYDRVEVMRGASGLLGGVGDPGGIVNLVRKKPLAQRQLRFEQSVGRWDHARSMLDASSALTADGRLRARAVASYESADSFIRHRSTERPSIYGVLEYDLTSDTLVTLGGSYGKQHNNGAPPTLPRYSDGRDLGLPRDANLSQPWAYDDSKGTELFLQAEHRFANRWKLKAHVTHTRLDIDRIYNYTSGSVDPVTLRGLTWGAGRVQTANTQDIADVNLSGSFALLGRQHEFLVGADWQRVRSSWTNSNLAVNYTVPVDAFNPGAWNPGMGGSDFGYTAQYSPWGQEQLGGYGVLRLHPSDRLHVIAGARVSKYDFSQHIETQRAGQPRTLFQDANFKESGKITPYGGVIYDLDSRWSAYVSYSSIYKPQPLLTAGPAPGSSLPPVKGRSYEAGLKGELLDGRLNATFSLFHVQRTGTAVADPSYPSTSNTYDGNCCYLAQGKVISKGLDMEVGGELLPGWQVAAGYTFNRTQDKSTQQIYSSMTPKHLLKLSTAYTLPGELSRWKLGGAWRLQSGQYVAGSARAADGTLQPYNFTQGGYGVLDAMLQYRIDSSWSLALNVHNLLDRTYYQSVGTLNGNNVYGSPRNLVLTLRGNF